jgi:hypothetical protein
MPTCPKGHDSVAGDYCDECGTPIGATPTSYPAGPPQAAETVSPPVPGASGAAGEKCPECGTPRSGRFCEVDGHDFLAVAPVPTPPVPQPPAGAGDAASEATASKRASNGGQAASPDGAALPRREVPGGWRVVVAADRAYHQRMQAVAEPDVEPIAFPVFCPERRFILPDKQVLIGRRSRTRGIEPDIDLTGPPEDAAVSHMHALLVGATDGWALVDLDSANGTYLNDSTEPIEANVPVALSDGDRIHVGAWTTMTILAG